MNTSVIELQPNRIGLLISVIGVLLECSFLFVAGLFVQTGINFLQLLLLLCLAVYFGYFAIIYTYNKSRNIIRLESNGLRVLNDGFTVHCFVPWSDFCYGYIFHTQHTCDMLILSKDSLASEDIAKISRSQLKVIRQMKENIVALVPVEKNKEIQILQFLEGKVALSVKQKRLYF